MMQAMRVGMVAALVVAVAACGKKDSKGSASAPRIDAAPQPIPACERYATALAASDDLVAQPEIHDLLRDEASLVRAANRAPSDAVRAELTMRCATGLVDLGKITTDGWDGDAGAPPGVVTAVDAGIAAAGSGPDCTEMLHAFDRIDACSDVPDGERELYRDRRSLVTRGWQNATDADAIDRTERLCRIAMSGLHHVLTQYSCP
jgi:hypothetical protein